MSLHRRNPKRDANEAAIVETLEKRGFSVHRVSAPGFPDLVVTKRIYTPDGYFWHPAQGEYAWFVEVKRPKGKFTKAQIAFRERWQGPPIYTLRSVDEALTFPEAA